MARGTYRLDVILTVVTDDAPEKFNRAAPEFTETHQQIVDAAENVARDRGYVVAHVGHGSVRLEADS